MNGIYKFAFEHIMRKPEFFGQKYIADPHIIFFEMLMHEYLSIKLRKLLSCVFVTTWPIPLFNTTG